MAISLMATKLPQRRIEKLLTQSIKQVISQRNLGGSTRSGNKELGFLSKKVAAAPFESEADVQSVGAAIGEKIVELSEQGNKQNLDAGVVRKLTLQNDWQREFNIPAADSTKKAARKTCKSAQVLAAAPEKSSAPKAEASAPVEEPAQEEPAQEEPVQEETTQEDPVSEAEIAPASEEEAIVEDAIATNPEPEVSENLAVEVAADAPETATEPAEVAVTESASEVSEAAESEVVEAANAEIKADVGAGAAQAAPADPEAGAAVNVAEEDA